jgi:nuclear pore complex protein Nup93
LAQAHINAPSLAASVAHFNANTTFTPLQALQDTDVDGYIRAAHEQTLIATIEESRRETEADFNRLLEKRKERDWEQKKKRLFDQLGKRAGGESRAVTELTKSFGGKASLAVRYSTSIPYRVVEAQGKKS